MNAHAGQRNGRILSPGPKARLVAPFGFNHLKIPIPRIPQICSPLDLRWILPHLFPFALLIRSQLIKSEVRVVPHQNDWEDASQSVGQYERQTRPPFFFQKGPKSLFFCLFHHYEQPDQLRHKCMPNGPNQQTYEPLEVPVVLLANTCADPGTVVVQHKHTTTALVTMHGSGRPHYLARHAKLECLHGVIHCNLPFFDQLRS